MKSGTWSTQQVRGTVSRFCLNKLLRSARPVQFAIAHLARMRSGCGCYPIALSIQEREINKHKVIKLRKCLVKEST